MTRKSTITCQGHPNIKASHAKTFEFTSDDDVTGTGTCIIGVQCDYNEDELLELRGAVSITLKCGEAEDVIQARMNPTFRRGDPLIIRRNTKPQHRTLCTSASKGASAINRDLVTELQKPGAELVITIEQLNEEAEAEGVLYIVGTPIGNNADISLRAIDTLQSVDAIIAEDTRTARAMLSEFGVSSEFISYHDHNERERTPQILARLNRGDRIALVSEAGMPLISDPGFHIVSAAVESGVEVSPVPGPDAVTTAIAMSGISASDFRFIGFPPRKSGQRVKLFEQFQEAEYAVIFFESPHRISSTLEDICKALDDRLVVICRDITKHTEQILRGSPTELVQKLGEQDKPRGELTIVIEPAKVEKKEEATGLELGSEQLIKALLEEGCPTKLLAAAIARTSDMKKRDAFNMLVAMKDDG